MEAGAAVAIAGPEGALARSAVAIAKVKSLTTAAVECDEQPEQQEQVGPNDQIGQLQSIHSFLYHTRRVTCTVRVHSPAFGFGCQLTSGRSCEKYPLTCW